MSERLFVIQNLKSKIQNVLFLVVILLFCSSGAVAGQLTERLASFPNWQHQPVVQVAKGDLVYPAWMRGTWSVTSTLIDLVAPLAPDIVTPGFESNRRYLHQPIKFQVRFVDTKLPTFTQSSAVVADRAFNGLNLARAYLGDGVLAVKVDPHSPNRQITLLRGERQLVSLVTGRATETTPDAFITTEIFQQVFRGGTTRPYFNSVETTAAYQYHHSSAPAITADQVTAVYLSPQDPNFFNTNSRPVALYRYRLEFYSVAPQA